MENLNQIGMKIFTTSRTTKNHWEIREDILNQNSAKRKTNLTGS
jgi:hypothetical protein